MNPLFQNSETITKIRRFKRVAQITTLCEKPPMTRKRYYVPLDYARGLKTGYGLIDTPHLVKLRPTRVLA